MWHSLGKVAITPGTPVRATTNETTPTKRYPCQTIFFQQVQSNVGKLWICDRPDAVMATGYGVLCTIPIPTLVGGVATILPYASVTVPSAPAALDVSRFWIDSDVNIQGAAACQVSVVCN